MTKIFSSMRQTAGRIFDRNTPSKTQSKHVKLNSNQTFEFNFSANILHQLLKTNSVYKQNCGKYTNSGKTYDGAELKHINTHSRAFSYLKFAKENNFGIFYMFRKSTKGLGERLKMVLPVGVKKSLQEREPNKKTGLIPTLNLYKNNTIKTMERILNIK